MLFFDIKVKSCDVEVKMIIFELVDYIMWIFLLKWGGWEEGMIGILCVCEEDVGVDGYGFQIYLDQDFCWY